MTRERIKLSGGGKKPSNPTYTSDNLRSVALAELLIGIGEGPIAGLEDGEKSFYVDSTALVASDGSRNFNDFDLKILRGTGLDEKVSFFLGGTSMPTSVNVELKCNVPLTRTTQSGDIDYIDISIAVSQLVYNSSNGSTSNSSVTFKIEHKATSSNVWQNDGTRTITGKTTSSAYYKDYRITVPRLKNSTYDIRLTKLTADSPSGSSGNFNTISFQSFEEIVADDREFKHTALAQLNIKTSDEISSMPQFSGVYKLLIVKVPSNYDPETKMYDGDWDGTFKMAWTDNPAWCLYDLIMNDRYGVNAYYPVVADKWDFYRAGRYCDERVPDGKGGTEARYTLNMVITDEQSGPSMINYIASTFNATIYEDATGLVRLSWETDSQAIHLFTKENVTGTGFTYSYSDPSSCFNEITVSFVNPNLDWSVDRRLVSNQENIDIWGRIPEDFSAVGCIKESEAIRRARYRLISYLTEKETVTFTTNRAAQCVNVFDTILVSDPDMGYGISGRISSVSENGYVVNLRDPIFLEAGTQYFMKVQTGSGIYELELDVREVGNVSSFRLLDALPSDTPEKATFSLIGNGTSKGEPKPYRVISISEGQGGDQDSMTITAIEINRNKQYEADYGIELPDVEVNVLPAHQKVPQILDLGFSVNYILDKKQTYLVLEPVLDRQAYPYYSDTFKVWSRLKVEEGEEENLWEERYVQFGDTIVDHPVGLYEFRVLPYSTLGVTPDFDEAPIFEYEVTDMGVPPAYVNNFKATPNVNNILLSWDEVSDYDIIGYEIRIGDTWETGKQICTYLTDTSFYYTPETTGEIRFMIKAVDLVGSYSTNYNHVTSALTAPKDVLNFYVTPNRDSVRFDWVAEQENGVEYEVRIGASWDSGLTLFKIKGTNNTILNPGDGTRGFMIKAVSVAGLYSTNYRYAQSKLDLHQNRNVILQIDNAADNWEGCTTGMEKTEFVDVLGMVDGVKYAEHYFQVSLPEVTRARNWYDTEGFKYGNKLTFEDLDFAWGSEEAASMTWFNQSGISSYGGTIQPVITTESVNNPYVGTAGFSFMNTTEEVNGAFLPTLSENVSYGDARFADGLVLNRIVNVRYGIDITNVFDLKFRLKLTQGSVSLINILRFETNAGETLSVYSRDDVMYVERSDGVISSLPFTRFIKTDFLNVHIKQDENKLYLAISTEYANMNEETEIDSAPLVNNYTKIYIGGRYV